VTGRSADVPGRRTDRLTPEQRAEIKAKVGPPSRNSLRRSAPKWRPCLGLTWTLLANGPTARPDLVDARW
jgi:hypothetical protein